MSILVTGSSGFVGKPLIESLKACGHIVSTLSHTEKDLRCEHFDAVINLAGKNILSGRWTQKQKRALFQSRCTYTWHLARSAARLKTPPKIWINASAVGIYGNRGQEVLTENSNPGEGFLADLCLHWERATSILHSIGTRVVCARFGIILDPSGGMLGRLIPKVRWHLAGKIGSGTQFISWISLLDVLRAIHHILAHPEISGPINLTTKHPVTQDELITSLAKHLHSTKGPPLPACLARLLFGPAANELLLSSTYALPEKLIQSGFIHKNPTLDTIYSTVTDFARLRG